MTIRLQLRCITTVLALGGAPLQTQAAGAQGQPAAPSPAMIQAAQLDRQGATDQARIIFRGLIDLATDPAAKAAAQRGMAMSYAFDGDCGNTVKYETMVIAYWATREEAEPQDALYQEGEIANEAARVCLDAGDLKAAERWYRRGYELGMREPDPPKHPRSLWEYRLAHGLGRIAARRGDTAEAHRQIAAARRALDGDTAMAAQQERFFPYLVGYVALYTKDLPTAEAQFTKAITLRGNQRDPFVHCLLAMTYERQGRKQEAKAMYQKAYDLATGHSAGVAFVRRFVREKLRLPP